MINRTWQARKVRALFALCVCGLALFSNRVEGQQGGGGSFGGAGAGGGMGGNMGSVPRGDVYTSSNILSPGDASDWPLEVRDGETLIISIKSSIFDPMVEIVDANNKKIAENDDVRRGVQDSLLLHYFPKGGKYKALVKAAKQGAGGSYLFSARRFIAAPTTAGTRISGALDKSQIQWRRFNAEAGQTVVLTTYPVSQVSMEVVAPNGERVRGVEGSDDDRRSNKFVFRAVSKGTHYARLSGQPNLKYALTVALARSFPLTIGQNPAPKKIEVDGLDLWKFQGKAGDLVSVRAKAGGMGVVSALEYLPPTRKDDEAEVPDESVAAPIVSLPSDAKDASQTVALLNRTGTYQIAVSQPTGQEIEYSLSLNAIAKPLPPNGASEGRLKIGGADYWAFEGKAGEVMRLGGASEQFDARIALYSPEGEEIGANDDGGEGTNALLTAILLRGGRYFLRMQSVGGGGSGAYRIQAARNPVKALAFDKREEGRIGSDGNEIWSFQGVAGQTVIISARSSDFDIAVLLRGPDGVQVGADDDGGDGTNSLLSRRLPLKGTYTVWVNAKQGRGSYVLRLMEAP